jgi:lambda family phage portal protein
MKILDTLMARLGYAPRRAARNSNFAAADLSRLTASLAAESDQINNVLRYQLRMLRARSRQLAQNNPYAKRFFQMVATNVAGAQPFRLQSKIKFKSGKLDVNLNRKVEAAYTDWGRVGHCELTGRYSLNAVWRMLARTLAVDGEIIVRKLRGRQYGPYGYQLQIIDVDRLDDLLNKALPGGGAIHMGVELDPQSRPVAYHLLKRKPASWQRGNYPRESERVPAEDIIHVFIPEFAEQVRGVPWVYAALLQLVHIGAFAEAAVIAARIGASQMGVIESPDGGKTLAESSMQDPHGNPQIQAEPGSFQMLPPGYTLSEGWDPKYPDAAIEPFLRSCLQGVAVGVNVAHHNLSGDMSGVTYSSARIAELAERDQWMLLQSHFTEHLVEPNHFEWQRMQALTGTLPLDISRMEQYREVYFQGRRWSWVDPAKEVRASLDAIEGRIKSRTRVVAEGGEDFEDLLDEIAEEQKLAAEKKVSLDSPRPAAVAPAAPAAGAGADPAKPEDEDDDDQAN